MRKENSLKNAIAAIGSNAVSIIIGLFAQAVFLDVLGEEYLGLNSLFANIISMLSIVELGVGSAIIFGLYKPIAENNYELINSLIQFYKKSYRIIAIIILIIGLMLIPFLDFIVGEITINIHIKLVFLLFLCDTVFSYFLSYKRSILYANQKNYLILIVHIGYTIILNLFQIISLIITQNFYLYLIIKIIMRIIENVIITIIANKKYCYLRNSEIKKLDKDIENDIFKKVKALFFHKIGTFVIISTDNIIISTIFGVATVGLYSNYFLIVNAVQSVFSQVIDSATASIGNLLVKENKEKQFDVFKKIQYLNLLISVFTNVCLLNIMESFISIWIGSEYILPKIVLIALVVNNFQKIQRSTFGAFKDAAGIFYEDRFIPLIESALNIIFSIIFAKIFGLAGVFMGTIVSSFVLWGYSYPKYVYKQLLGKNYIEYVINCLKDIIYFAFILVISYLPIHFVNINNEYFFFAYTVLISMIVPSVLIIMTGFNNPNFKYYFNLIKSFFNRGEKNEKNRNYNLS